MTDMMGMPGMKSGNFSVKLSNDEREKLEALSRRTGRSCGNVVRWILANVDISEEKPIIIKN